MVKREKQGNEQAASAANEFFSEGVAAVTGVMGVFEPPVSNSVGATDLNYRVLKREYAVSTRS